MGDPLSAAASILALIQATDFVLTACYTYVGRVKNAEADIDRIVQETSLLKGLFLNLHELAQDEPENERLRALVSEGGPLAICREALGEIERKLKPPQSKLSTSRRLLWPFDSKKLDEILERIRNQKPTLLLSLATDNAGISRDIKSGVKDIQISLESAQLQEKRDKILDWLRPHDPKEKHLNSRRVHERGSNQWVLDHQDYLKWRSDPRQNIWLHGIPGSGKTIISSTIIEDISNLRRSESGNKVAYYYFDFNDASNQKLTVLLRSLIFQLCVEVDSIPASLTILYDECNRGRSDPAVESLVDEFFSILNSSDSTYIIIDGLDECPLAPERSNFETLVLETIGQHPGNYNFLITSRKEFDIEESVKRTSKQVEFHTVQIETENVDSDVRLHVQRFISEHKRISTWSESIRNEIQDELVKGSQGMFRWIELQLRSIGSCILPGAARKKLKQLPGTLYDSYDRILESVSDENVIAVRSALMFLAYSLRPMLVEELADAVLINVEDQSFDPEERSDDPLSVILELCSSLVTISTASDSDRQWLTKRRFYGFRHNYMLEKIVKFSHYSVKEYIISKRHEHTALNSFYFSEQNAHHHISEALLLYIIAIGSTESTTRSRFEPSNDDLAMYAAAYWPKHYRLVPQDHRQETLVELVRVLFNTEEPGPYMYWLNHHNQDYTDSGSLFDHRAGRILSDFQSPVYIASLLGELTTWQWLIDNGFRIDDPSGNRNLGDPLQAAALGNHIEIVRRLLDLGAKVNTSHGHFGDPLQAAAFGGGQETVKFLTDHGANINTEHGEYGNALIAAAHRGHVAIAKLLIDRGADPELCSREHGKAIAGAAANGNSELIRLLLLKGNDINDPNGSRGSALYCASGSGDIQVVRMLVKAGADVNLVSGRLHTALQAACNEGHLEVAKFLIANGAAVNIFGGRLDSALQACIDNGNLEIMQLLLSHGADMNHEGGLYRSPLHCATFRGKARAAEILLDRGAIFNDEIFLMAIEYEHPSLVSRMLAKGVDVNCQNKNGSALQLAARRKNSEAINALLSGNDIDIDARGGEHGDTALQIALSYGYEDIARKLLLMGASVNLEAGEYYKALTAAAVGKNVKLIQFVLDAGADVNGHRGGWYESALNCAAFRGMRDAVELLLDCGADVTELSGKNEETMRTPLQAACENGHFELAKVLISRGADINAPAGEEGSALTCVVKPKWGRDIKESDVDSMFLYLLDRGADLSCPDSATGCSAYHSSPTALDTAIWQRKRHIIDLLISRDAELCASSLRLAASRGDDEVIRRYLLNGGDINVTATALCQAIENENSSTIQLFLDSGADVNAQLDGDHDYGCALGYAVEKGDRNLVERLLELGADPSSRAGRFGSALRNAVQAGHSDIATLLIEKGADLNYTTKDFPGPLASAVGNANETMINQLLEAGADVNGEEGYPFVSACTRGKIHIVQMLLDAGANPRIQEGVPENALQRAAEWGHLDVCKLLISQGADINAQGGEKGNPLRAALANMHNSRTDASVSTIQYLLGAGANPNAPPSGNHISTLAAAVSNGHGDLIDALVSAGADVNAHSPELGTALIASARRAAPARTFKLLEHGADPHLTGGRWGSAIHAAAQNGEPQVVERLLDLGVSSNLVAGRYGYVLQAACNPQGSVNYMGCIRVLLARGADVNARGGKYATALQCAAKHGKLDAVRLLMEHGADPAIQGGKYGSASRAAREEKHWHVYNYLERHREKA